MDENEIEGAIREGVGRVQDAFGGATGDANTQFKGKLNQAAGAAQKVYGQARDQACDLASNAGDLISERPYAAVGVAALGGLVIGLIIGAVIAS